ncbi:MAG: M14 family metallocarboxypeptidase [Verrucomicrobiota bacterium]
MERLGKNIGGYRGETLDLPMVLREMEKAAAAKHWARDIVPLDSKSAAQPLNFIAWRRPVESTRKCVYLSAGIHGDEPAGPLAALQLLQEDLWPADMAIWFCPCLNPTGFLLNRRENSQGIDLNRDYRHLQSAETRAHVSWLKQQPGFDLSLCLHEDWESHGFYLYELNPDQRSSLAAGIVEAVSEVCPIERAPMIDTWPAENGVIRPRVNPAERPQWPESLHLITYKTRQSYTFEAPSDFPLPGRVAALVTAVRAALRAL